MQKKTTLIGLLFLAAAIIPAGLADTPGRHPRYLHARTDLRAAQWLLRVHDEPNVMNHIRAVDQEIDRAVFEIDQASVLDRRDLRDHPPVDERMDRRGRFGRAMELLREARAEIDREEDNPAARGWRNRAFEHIDGAIDQLRRAARDLRLDHMEGF
ncbi:MAG: hypothetical protein ACLPX8_23835 [Bryobacteraceae bacterium]|jgi:hypothetical protein